jgi:hypothetical protein
MREAAEEAPAVELRISDSRSRGSPGGAQAAAAVFFQGAPVGLTCGICRTLTESAASLFVIGLPRKSRELRLESFGTPPVFNFSFA